jgi:hypothetical protein
MHDIIADEEEEDEEEEGVYRGGRASRLRES